MMMPTTSRRSLMAMSAATLACGLAAPAAAQLRVNVGRGSIAPLPIAVSPFAGDGAGGELGTRIADVVVADLESSGLFRPIDREAFIQSPDEMRELPRFADWRQINAQALVTGLVRSSGSDALTVEFRLWDVFAGSQIKGLLFNTTEPQWRRIAHKVADAVYERLTGEGGYFDTRIAYVAESGPPTRRIKRLALMDQDGANHSFLTDGRDLVLTPRFSPDADRLAYLAFRGRKPQVFMRELASGRDALLGNFDAMTFSPRFSPDGRSMLLTIMDGGDADIYRYDLGARRTSRLTNGGAINTSPSFSPDGREIVFNSDRGGPPHLYVMGGGGSGVRRISYGDGRYGEPVWSPDGALVAFSKLLRGSFHIGIMRPDGGDERLLTRSYLDETPAWAPNGRIILFSRQDPRTNQRRLFSVDITGYNEREVPTPLDASGPDWSPLLE